MGMPRALPSELRVLTVVILLALISPLGVANADFKMRVCRLKTNIAAWRVGACTRSPILDEMP